MRQNKYIIICLLLVVTASCTGRQKDVVQEEILVTFDSIMVEERLPLLADKADSTPYATAEIHFVYPNTYAGGAGELKKLQSLFYQRVFGEQYVGISSPEETVRQYIAVCTKTYRDEFLEEYREAFDSTDLYSEEDRQILLQRKYHWAVRNRKVYTNAHLMSFTVVDSKNLGGTHGYDAQRCFSIDLNALDYVTLNHIIRPESQALLTNVVKKKLLELMRKKASRYSGASLEDRDVKTYFSDFNKIRVTENFMLTETGLVFVYNPYEIADYASGSFEVEIPYHEIVGLLDAEAFARLMPEIAL